MDHPKQERYFLHSTARSASHVLLRILNLPEQPNLNPAFLDGYFFIPYFFHQRSLNTLGKDPTTWSPDQHSQLKSTLLTCITRFSSFLRETSEKKQRCLIKER